MSIINIRLNYSICTIYKTIFTAIICFVFLIILGKEKTPPIYQSLIVHIKGVYIIIQFYIYRYETLKSIAIFIVFNAINI